jgi:hypothetical protein
VIKAIPKELQGRLEPAEVFHQLLDHRWYISQNEKRDVPLAEAGVLGVAPRALPHCAPPPGPVLSPWPPPHAGGSRQLRSLNNELRLRHRAADGQPPWLRRRATS